MVFSIILVVIILISVEIPVYAATMMGYRHSGSTIYYYYDNWVGSRAASMFSYGADTWKNATTEVTLNHYSLNPGTGYDVYMCAGNIENVFWDAVTQTTASYGIVTSQTLTLNMSATATWNNDGALESVVVHEVGHIFGLGEEGKIPVIMNPYTFGENSRYGEYGLTTPQTDDINGVNYLY